MWSNRIVGYAINERMTARLAVAALETAARSCRHATVGRPGDGTCPRYSCTCRCRCRIVTIARTHHLEVLRRPVDSGQFRARKCTRALARHGLVGSMGNVATAADNTAMESFFALLQNNVLDQQRWATRDQLRVAILTWIKRTYHRRRRQDRLGRLTPIEYETIMPPPALQAA